MQHVLYFMSLAEQAEPYLASKDQLEWLNILDDEHSNFRAALGWSRETSEQQEDEDDRKDEEDVVGAAKAKRNGVPLETGLRTAGALSRFWYLRGYLSEGRGHLDKLLFRGTSGSIVSTETSATLGASPRYRAKALLGSGHLAYSQGDYDEACSLYEAGLDIHRRLGDG